FLTTQAKQAGVIRFINAELREACEDYVLKRLFPDWPGRFIKTIFFVFCKYDLVGFKALFFTAYNYRPERFRLLDAFERGLVPVVLQIPGGNLTQEQDVFRFGCERQAEALNSSRRDIFQREVFIDQMEPILLLAFDRHIDETQLR